MLIINLKYECAAELTEKQFTDMKKFIRERFGTHEKSPILNEQVGSLVIFRRNTLEQMPDIEASADKFSETFDAKISILASDTTTGTIRSFKFCNPKLRRAIYTIDILSDVNQLQKMILTKMAREIFEMLRVVTDGKFFIYGKLPTDRDHEKILDNFIIVMKNQKLEYRITVISGEETYSVDS